MTLIIGKSANFSIALSKALEDSYLVPSDNPLEYLKAFSFKKTTPINIIFNNFQKSSLLSDFSDPVRYIQRSVDCTAQVLSYVEKEKIKIKRVIYTSSSSVYGNNIFCQENDTLKPMNLHASLKITNEKIIETFCKQYDINYTICRVFNMYGGVDEFSIISKIINAATQNEKLILYNNGNAIRDFIHIDDVVKIYCKLIKELSNIPIINIGTSEGVSIKSILDFLANNNIVIKYESMNKKELNISTANIEILRSFMDIAFKNVKEVILEKVLKNKRLII